MPLLRSVVLLVSAISLLAQIPSTSEREEYRAITDTVYFRGAPGQKAETMLWSHPSEYEEANRKLAALVTSTALNAAVTPGASSQSVQSAMSGLQGELTPEAPDPDHKIPFADLTRTSGAQTLFLAFSVMSGHGGIPENKSSLQFFSNGGGTWKLVSAYGKDFDGCFFSAARMRSMPSGEERFVVWGRAYGDTGSRLKIQVFSFDGREARAVYSRDELVRGIASFESGRIALSYQDPSSSPYAAPIRVREVLEPDSSGMRQVSREYEK